MSITHIVSTIFKGKDEQSKAFKQMGKNAKLFGETTSRSFKKASKSASNFSNITKGILAAGAVTKGVGLIGQGVQSAATDFLNFDQAVTSASAKFKGLNLATKEGQKTLEALKKSAREVGATTEFNAAQAAGGLDFLALAGFNAKQAMALLPGVTNLATVANVDLATATDIASDSLGAFGLMMEDPIDLAREFTRVQDVMAKTTATSNTSLTDLFEAVQKGAPDFTAAGQSIETFSALIGTMANAGIKGSEAGTKLRNMAVRLTGGSKDATDAIKSLGIKVADSSGNFRDMLDIIDDVQKGTAKMGSVQRAAALKTIFGARQTGGLNVILKEGASKLKAYRQSLIDSSKASEQMATVMRSSLINRLKSLGSAATEVGFQLFSAFDEQGATAIDNLTQAIRGLDLKPVIEGIKSAWETAKQLFDIVHPFLFLIPAVTAAFITWHAVLKAQAAFKAVQVMIMLGKAIKAAGAAQAIFNLFMAANPLGIVLTAAAALIALTVTIIKNWDAISDSIGNAVSAVKGFLGIGEEPGSEQQVAGANGGAGGIGSPVRQPPNRQQVQSKASQITSSFGGQLTIANAPKGSTFEPDKNADPVDVKFLGQQASFFSF